jgi:hypothetical protein
MIYTYFFGESYIFSVFARRITQMFEICADSLIQDCFAAAWRGFLFNLKPDILDLHEIKSFK